MSPESRSWPRAALPPEVREALASGLPASEVWSVLLGIMEARATARAPATLREQWARDRFVEPCYIDQRTLTELDSHLLAAASAFEAVELSPLAPLGVCSAVALASQNKVVSTTRGTEVVSDPTNVLALECARRLRDDPTRVLRLVTNHRCVRAQAVPKLPGFAAHFRMFCIVSAGHEQKSRGFLAGELTEHVLTHLAALNRLEQHAGYSFGARRLRLMTTGDANRELVERVADDVRARLASGGTSGVAADAGDRAVTHGAGTGSAMPRAGAADAGAVADAAAVANVGAARNAGDAAGPSVANAGLNSPRASAAPLPIEFGPLDRPYYDGIRFQIDATTPDGVVVPLIDGGCFDWLRTLMSHGKMVFVASAMGSQVAAYLFRKPPAGQR